MDELRVWAPFSRWDESAVRRLLAGTETHPFRTGKALFYQGDRANRGWLVLSGAVRSVMYRSDESTLDLGVHGPGDWLGLPELVLGGPCLADAVALEGCRALAFDKVVLGRWKAAPGGTDWLSAELARQCYALHARVEVAQPGQRLARWLVSRRDRRPGAIDCTQDELAVAIGTTRETVNRHLGRLQAEGLLRVERGRVTVLDVEALATWGGE